MKNIKIIFEIFTFTFIATTTLRAQQTTTFQLDTISNSILTPLPFDRPSMLLVKGSGAVSIKSAFILEWKLKHGVRKFKAKKDGTVEYQFIKADQVFHIKDGIGLNIPPLKPNRDFTILFSHFFDGDLLNDLYKTNYLLLNNSLLTADSVLLNIEKKVGNKVQPIAGLTSKDMALLEDIKTFNFFDNKYPQNNIYPQKKFAEYYKNFFSDSLKSSYTNLGTNLILYRTSPLPRKIFTTVFRKLDSLKISSSDLNDLAVIEARGEIGNVQLGKVAIGKDLIQCELFEFDNRVSNFKKSIKAIENARQQLDLMEFKSNQQEIVNLSYELVQLSEALIKNCKLLENTTKFINGKISEQSVRINYSSWAIGDNEFADLKTKGSYLVIPELGLVNIFALGNVKGENIIRPYLGASIYLRPVDKSIPFKYLKGRFWHQFSFSFGLTVGKIEKGEFSDLYNSMTLLTGGNFKISREISFSFGIAMMNRKDVNIAISDSKFSANPYVGLSFDVDFLNSIQKLTGKLF